MNAKTDNHTLAGKGNLLTDALHEMGYDDSLAGTLIERGIVDFNSAEYTSHVMDDLIERYGEEVLCGGLPRAVAREDAQVKLAKGENIEKFIQDIITDGIEALGLKAVNGANLEKTRNLPRELGRVKRIVSVDYGEFGFHLPGVDIIVYYPDTCRVLAVISTGASSKATLSERIAQAGYWKLKLLGDETTRHVKVFLISSDEDGILKRDNNPPNKPKAMIETELDGSYILTEAELDESEKIKPFGRFSEDLKLMVDNIDRSKNSTH